MADNIEEGIDLSELKVIGDDGQAQPVEINEPKKEETTEEASENTDAVENVDSKVEDEGSTESTEEEAKSTEAEPEPEKEEETQDNEENIEAQDDDDIQPASDDTVKLFDELDNISKELSNGKAETLEDFFEEYKRMRDSSNTQFKDDYIKNAVEYYNANGNLQPYLEVSSVKFDEMTDEQIMRHNLEKSHPTLSKRAIDKLYERDIVQKYNLDEDKYDESDVELGKELLQADASKLKQKFIEDQAKFIQPQQVEEQGNTQQELEEQMNKWIETVSSNDTTKDVVENKRILVEYGDDKFAYEIDNPSDLQEMTVDNNKFFKLFRDEQGNIDFEKWYKVLAFAVDPEVYDSSLISHGQELGQAKVVKDLKNPSKPTKAERDYKTPSSPLEGLIGALARGDSDVKIIR